VPEGKILRSEGAITDRGPIPPTVDSETTYTVNWYLANSFNDVANATMKAELPPYVRWTGNFTPASEQLTYDSSSRTVTWTIPDLRAGVGYTSAAKHVAFQIAFLPTVSQANTSPDLISSATVVGSDRFTASEVRAGISPLSTRFNQDSDFRTGDDRVRD
jgi:hypothetical protein